jgi:DNA repair protein RadC
MEVKYMNVYELSSIKTLFAEALAEKPGSYVVEEIFSRFPSLIELMNVTEQELIAIKGIGKVKARQIIAALQLARKINAPISSNPYIIRSPKDAADILIPEMRYLQQEHGVCLFLNTKNMLINNTPVTIAIGSLNSAIIHPRELFRMACKLSASSLIFAHNHPSGDTTPSPEDIQLSVRLKECGELMGIDVLDSIIVAGDSYCSLKERGLV